jgi:uncharacterized protein YegL
MARRQLHFVFVLDRSGSMNADGKIQALNIAIAESLPLLRSAALDNVGAEVLVRAAVFSDGASWHSAEPLPVDRFRWLPIDAAGLTDLGAALTLVAEVMETPPMPERALPPVLLLVSDGRPTDDYGRGLAALLRTAWGPRSLRLAVAIGRDADRGVLQEFIGYGSGHTPIQADDPESIVEAIQWATTAATRAAAGGTLAPAVDDDIFVLEDEDEEARS